MRKYTFYKPPFNLILIIVLCTFSCKEKGFDNPNFGKLDFDFSIVHKPSSYKIELDSITAPNSFDVIQRAKDTMLVGYNKLNRGVYFYNLKTGMGEMTMKLAKDGPNGVGEVDGVFLHSDDSLFVLSYVGQVFLLNSHGHVKKKYKYIDPFSNEDNNRLLTAHPEWSFPLRFTFNLPNVIGDKLYLTGIIEESRKLDLSQAGVLLRYNMSENEIDYLYNYPELYEDRIWTYYFRRSYRAYNSKKGSFLYSFPADHYVHEIDLEGNLIEKHYGGSNHIERIKYPNLDENDLMSGRMRDLFYFLNNSYGAIIYNGYLDQYYRLAYMPYDTSIENEDIYSRKLSLIVMNGEMEPIAESIIEDNQNYLWHLFFVSKEGLNVGVKQVNEDILSFELFTIE